MARRIIIEDEMTRAADAAGLYINVDYGPFPSIYISGDNDAHSIRGDWTPLGCSADRDEFEAALRDLS